MIFPKTLFSLFVLLAIASPALTRDFVVKRDVVIRSHKHAHLHSHQHAHLRSHGHGHGHSQTYGHGHDQDHPNPSSAPPSSSKEPPTSTAPGERAPPHGQGTNSSSTPMISSGGGSGSCSGLSKVVSGCPTGFGAKTTGGGNATPVYPKTNQELQTYLMSPDPQVIVLTKEFNFVGTEGTASARACAPWGTAPGCQIALELGKGWCKQYQANAPWLNKPVTYDKAGTTALTIASHKTIVGQGSAGVIRGKGIRMAAVENIIIQNIKIHQVNSKFVWGGDGIDIAGVQNLWIDHVTIHEIGRQLMVAHERPNRDVTISYVHFDGSTQYSSYCNGKTYWMAKFSGPRDTITLSNNYFNDFMGRAPQVAGEGGTSLLHVVNNLWDGGSASGKGHAFEVLKGGNVLAEGNYLTNVPLVLDESKGVDSLFTASSAATSAACVKALGRPCALNVVSSSPAFDYQHGNVLKDSDWSSLPNVPDAVAAHQVLNLASTAGYGRL